jgi:hypothetical protein
MNTQAYVGFSTSKSFGGLLSRMICWLDNSEASHTWVVYQDLILQCHVVLEAHATGFRAVPYEVFRRQNNVVRIIQPKHSISSGLPTAAAWLGTHYDFAGLFGMFWVVLGRMLKKRWRNPLRSSNAQFCSEAVARVLQAANFPGAKNLHPDDCGPQDIIRLLHAESSETIYSK